MNRPRVLRLGRRLDLSSRASRLAKRERESLGPDVTRRVARCWMRNRYRYDNRVQRSDNAYIIVGAFALALWGEKSVRAIRVLRRYTKMTAEFNIMRWIYLLRRYTLHSLTLQRHNESQADLRGISQSHSSLCSAQVLFLSCKYVFPIRTQQRKEKVITGPPYIPPLLLAILRVASSTAAFCSIIASRIAGSLTGGRISYGSFGRVSYKWFRGHQSAANENRMDFYGARPINRGMSNVKVLGVVDKDVNGDKEKS